MKKKKIKSASNKRRGKARRVHEAVINSNLTDSCSVCKRRGWIKRESSSGRWLSRLFITTWGGIRCHRCI
jgi:hypothetical protein